MPISESLIETLVNINYHLPSVRRPCAVSAEYESVIAYAIRYYAEMNNPLTMFGIIDFIQQYINLLSLQSKGRISLNINRPSMGFINFFLKKIKLVYRSVAQVETVVFAL